MTYDAALQDAERVAEAIGLPADRVYKTLVVLPEGNLTRTRPFLVMIAGNQAMDPRRLARSIGQKAVRMAPQKEAERLTGLQVGGIGALALTGKNFTVYLDRAALDDDWIVVNGGRRGVSLRLRVADLIELTGARIVDATAGAASRARGAGSRKAEVGTSPPAGRKKRPAQRALLWEVGRSDVGIGLGCRLRRRRDGC